MKIIETKLVFPASHPDTKGISARSQPLNSKPEILSGGFIDFIQSGQMNASARLFRLYLGEPGKFQLPVSVYTGVSSNNLSANRQKEDLVFQLINPGNGIINMCFEGNNRIIGRETQITSFSLQYQSAIRFLSTYDRHLVKNMAYFNFITGAGFTFITGAWERSRVNNMGFYWFNLRGLYSYNPPSLFRTFFSVPVTHNLLAWSAGMGIEINKTLNVKLFYFHFLNNRDVTEFTQPVFQIGFNYSLM